MINIKGIYMLPSLMCKFKPPQINMEKFITANNTIIRVAEYGKGDKTLVLLHGYLESLDVWEDFIPLFSSDMKVVAVDLPGHGISKVVDDTHTMSFLAETVAEALKQLNIEKCTLLGHSMGGYVGLEFLHNHSDMLDGLILLHATANPDTEEKIKNRERQISIVEKGKKESLRELIANRFADVNQSLFEERIEELKELVTITDEKGVIAILKGMNAKHDLNSILRSSTIPQLLILGRHDNYIDSNAANTMMTAQPQAKVVWLENSGHMGFIEEPEATANAIKDFMNHI